MRYFLDTEFNGFAGELISLALVPEHGDQEFYAVLPLPDHVHSWVARNVVPYLHSVPVGLDGDRTSRLEAATGLAHYLAGDEDPVIVADWPEDIAHFCALLVTGPGDMAPVGSLRFEFLSSPGFSTSVNSKVPHNALHDARALRDFVLRGH
jgi:3' exoribonuclease, RNase T-like